MKASVKCYDSWYHVTLVFRGVGRKRLLEFTKYDDPVGGLHIRLTYDSHRVPFLEISGKPSMVEDFMNFIYDTIKEQINE